MLAVLTASLLASAVLAQTNTPSVVTFISISPTPSAEQMFSIQTINPYYSTTACYENCIVPPCSPCGNSPSIPPVPMPTPISVSIPSGSMAVSLPSPISVSIPSGSMAVPLPSPISVSIPSGSMAVPLPSPISVSIPSGGPSGTTGNGTAPSATSSIPPQQTTAGASSLVQSDNASIKLVLAVSCLALLGASLMGL